MIKAILYVIEYVICLPNVTNEHCFLNEIKEVGNSSVKILDKHLVIFVAKNPTTTFSGSLWFIDNIELLEHYFTLNKVHHLLDNKSYYKVPVIVPVGLSWLFKAWPNLLFFKSMTNLRVSISTSSEIIWHKRLGCVHNYLFRVQSILLSTNTILLHSNWLKLNYFGFVQLPCYLLKCLEYSGRFAKRLSYT